MASKLATVLVLLVLCQLCLSIRMRRDAAAENKVEDTSDSSSEESLDKIVADLGKVLDAKENEEMKKIVDNVNAAKTEKEQIDAYMKMFEFGVKTMVDHMDDKDATTPAAITPATNV